jgi:uncharacterized protein YceK
MRIMASLLLVLLLSGCATTIRTDSAFGPGKRYAIVSICADDNVSLSNSGGGTISGVVKALASKDAAYSSSSENFLNDATPRIVKAFLTQKRIVVLPERVTSKNPGFSSAKSDEPVVRFGPLSSRFRVANGYKYFSDEQKLAQLAKAMKVDGVIVVRISFSVSTYGVSAFGLISAGTQAGEMLMQVTAIDQSGKQVWVEGFHEKSKDTIGFVGESVDFVKIRPLFVQASDAVIKAMVESLDSPS